MFGVLGPILDIVGVFLLAVGLAWDKRSYIRALGIVRAMSYRLCRRLRLNLMREAERRDRRNRGTGDDPIVRRYVGLVYFASGSSALIGSLSLVAMADSRVTELTYELLLGTLFLVSVGALLALALASATHVQLLYWTRQLIRRTSEQHNQRKVAWIGLSIAFTGFLAQLVFNLASNAGE